MRVPLSIIDGRLKLMAVVECRPLRVQRQILSFVIDTGSPDSFLLQKDVSALHIPLADRPSLGDTDFGGSRYRTVSLPVMKFYLLREDDNKHFELNVRLNALKSSKKSKEKIEIAYSLPSILGIDFLREQECILYVDVIENMAYLEFKKIQ